MKKICVFVGSRANYGRLSALINGLANDFRVYIIGANSLQEVKHELLVDYYIQADMYEDLPMNEANTIALIAQNVTTWLANNPMDLAIVHGDRFECLGFAIAVRANRVPLIHMEAGELSIKDNETRWAISALAQYHMCPTIESFNRMKTDIYRPYFVGSPVVDDLMHKKLKGVDWPTNYILIMYNPVSDTEFVSFFTIMQQIIKGFRNIHFIWINPNIDPGNKFIVETIKDLEKENHNCHFLKNIEVNRFLDYMYEAMLIVGNTSAGIKEGAVLGIPYYIYGLRQDQRDLGLNSTRCHTKKAFKDRVLQAIEIYQNTGRKIRIKYDNTFGNGKTVETVIEIVKEILNVPEGNEGWQEI